MAAIPKQPEFSWSLQVEHFMSAARADLQWGRPVVCAGRHVPLYFRSVTRLQNRTGRPGGRPRTRASAPQLSTRAVQESL